jgi:ATP-binding protein involved in chromosome partitioning
MKYAVPLSDGALSAHFGHCEKFAIIDVDESQNKIVGKELVTPPPHQPGVFPKWLGGMGVNVILAGGMGAHARDLFLEQDITVVTGVMEDNPEKAVMDYIKGSLETGADACDHSGEGHSCQH